MLTSIWGVFHHIVKVVYRSSTWRVAKRVDSHSQLRWLIPKPLQMLQLQSLQMSTHIAAFLGSRWAATVHTDLIRLRWRTLGTCHIRGAALARSVSLRGCKHTDGGRRGLVALPASCSIAYLAALKQGTEGSDPCAPCTQLKQTASWSSSLGVKKLLDRVHDKKMGLLDLI